MGLLVRPRKSSQIGSGRIKIMGIKNSVGKLESRTEYGGKEKGESDGLRKEGKSQPVFQQAVISLTDSQQTHFTIRTSIRRAFRLKEQADVPF